MSHEFGSPHDEVNDCQHLSIVYRELGDLDRARECLLDGWQLAQRPALDYERGALSEGLGNLSRL